MNLERETLIRRSCVIRRLNVSVRFLGGDVMEHKYAPAAIDGVKKSNKPLNLTTKGCDDLT